MRMPKTLDHAARSAAKSAARDAIPQELTGRLNEVISQLDDIRFSKKNEKDLSKEYRRLVDIVEKPKRIEKLRTSEPIEVNFSPTIIHLSVGLQRNGQKKTSRVYTPMLKQKKK